MTNEVASTSAEDTIPALEMMNDAYLNYSMYVIMDRSLPHIGDGLKPVQRRVLHAMNELKLSPQSKYKKSARTVGDVLGKYHPHGDSACYEAMVNLAQSFNTRYPLIDGQGNWGSVDDPKSFAAMRYTESKLTAYAQTMLDEIKQDTVDWVDNFDGSLKQPVTLPAQLPNLLLNGVTGIAVGMATDIPPFNIDEVVGAVCQTISKVKTTDDDIISFFTAPDFPCGGTVINSLSQMRNTYLSGKGSVTLRADYEIDAKNNTLTFKSGPYRGDFNKIVEKISNEIKLHKLPVSKIQDLSDKNTPIRLQLQISGRNKAEYVLKHLLSNTDLEKTEKINLNCIGINGQPYVRSLPTLIREWCEYRTNVFVRKKNFRLRAVEARLHILDGFLIAFDNIEEIVRIIRESEHPKPALMERFDLSDIQATAILALRLSQLSKLESTSLREEKAQLESERDELMALLSDDGKIRRSVVSEIKKASKPFLGERKSLWVEDSPTVALSPSELVDEGPATVLFSKHGWVRAQKGHDVNVESLKFKTNDSLMMSLETQNNLPVIMIGSQGRCFAYPVHKLPNGKSAGDPINSKIQLQGGESITHLLPFEEAKKVLFTTRKGLGFISPIAAMNTKVKKGRELINLTEGDEILTPHILTGQETEVAILTQAGRVIVFPLNSINEYEKAKGMQLIGIKDDEFNAGHDSVVDIMPFEKGQSITILLGKRRYVLDDEKLDTYRSSRARRGTFFEGKRPKSRLSFDK